jgi:hypothetical protein
MQCLGCIYTNITFNIYLKFKFTSLVFFNLLHLANLGGKGLQNGPVKFILLWKQVAIQRKH